MLIIKYPLQKMPIFNVTDDNVSKAAQIIIKGGLIGIPTETVYGLAANCFDEQACANIFKTKLRPANDPLIVHISDVKQLDIVSVIFEYQKLILSILTDKFWPGPLTVILQKHETIPFICTAGGKTIGVRFPGHPIAQKLISTAGVPLAAPSANLFGHISPVTAQHVQNDFPDLFILDGGNCQVGLESTVLQIKENNEIFIYRRGGITDQMITNALQEHNIDFKITSKHISSSSVEKAQVSPGTNITHYAPNNCQSMFLIKGMDVLQTFFKKNIESSFQTSLEQNKLEIKDLIKQTNEKSIAVVNCSHNFDTKTLQQLTDNVLNIYDICDTPHQKFFYTLHQVEANNHNLLIIIPPIYDGQYDQFGASLFDRIFRCCSGKYAIFPEK